MAPTKDPKPAEPQKINVKSEDRGDAFSQLDEAHLQFCRALQEVRTPDDVHTRLAEAHVTYLRALQEANNDPLRSYEAYLEYVRAQQKAMLPDEVVARANDAYRSYLQAVKDAWGRFDVEDMNPSSLAELGQRLMMVAMHASQLPTQDRQDAR